MLSRRLGRGLLDYDGHGTFSPDGRWMVTDSYPNQLREQNLFLMEMATEAVLPLGRFIEPPPFGASGAATCIRDGAPAAGGSDSI